MRLLIQLTTVAWNEDKELLCHAHSKGVKIVIKHNFDFVEKLCEQQFRAQWIQVSGSIARCSPTQPAVDPRV